MEAADLLKRLVLFSRYFRRMSSGVDPLQFEDTDVCINGGCFGTGMSEKLLNKANVRAAFEHVRCAGVTK